MQKIFSIPKSVVGPARSFPNFSSRVFSWSCRSTFVFLIGDGGLGACKISLCWGELGGGGESLPFVAFAETKKFSQCTDYATRLCRVDNGDNCMIIVSKLPHLRQVKIISLMASGCILATHQDVVLCHVLV